jgi:PTH1 family peptidyl-tRNA hydrolase
MNRSGEAAKSAASKFKIAPADIIVVHDDLDLNLGTIRVKKGGSSGGHKGVQSIIDFLGTLEFVRVRIGITGEKKVSNVISFVLSEFKKEEKEPLENSITKAADAVLFLLKGNSIEQAMNRFN